MNTYLIGEQPEKALPLVDEFITIFRGQYTPDDPVFAGLLAHLSLDLLQYRQYPAAERIRVGATADHESVSAF